LIVSTLLQAMFCRDWKLVGLCRSRSRRACRRSKPRCGLSKDSSLLQFGLKKLLHLRLVVGIEMTCDRRPHKAVVSTHQLGTMDACRF
jgi:hypothetical protein